MVKANRLVNAVLNGDRQAVARAITIIENNTKEAQEISSQLYAHTGKAQKIGITGPGGVGKSTLVEKLIRELRKQCKTVGVIAVDPTSPFSGGAFLGDRIRMQELSTEEGVFIRSMATRNNPGGVARATKDAVRILDASGKDVVIVETVGAGQSEVDIMKIADTVVVVLAPGFGDEIQAIKAGLMEIGDIFVVNKADRENANKAITDIQAMLELGNEKDKWNPPIVRTIATSGEGSNNLLAEIEKHRNYLVKGEARLKQRQMIEAEFIDAIKLNTVEHIVESLRKTGKLNVLISKMVAREIDPVTAAEKIVSEYIKKPNKD